MIVEKINYQGWANCYRLSNGVVDLIVTTDVGPRIIRFGFVGEENEFKEYADQLGKTGGDTWRIYGGHRLWHAPERMPRTYAPDNAPVAFEQLDDGARIVQPTEATTGIAKEIAIYLAPDAARVRVIHRLTNRNLWAVKFAPWALTVMAPGGKAIIPLPPRGSHPKDLPPTSRLVLWAYTDLADARWTLGSRYVMLHQDAAMPTPQKIGASAPDGWCACVCNGHLFVKRFAYDANAIYPDLGCCVETFANDTMLELETLGPLTCLAPGEAVEHVETWHLFREVQMPITDADVEHRILPIIGRIRHQGSV